MQNRILQNSSSLIVLLLVLLSFLPLITAYRHPIYLNDDSYITLTYAKNLAQGNGFVFNYPPAVLGTTTPLFTIVIAGLASIYPQLALPTIAVFMTAFSWLGMIWIFYFFRKEWGLDNWQVVLLAMVLIGSGWIDFLGMEAYPFAFLLVLSISLFLKKCYWLTGFVIGLLFLTRGEGVLILALLSITISVQHWVKKKPINFELVQKILGLVGGFTLPVLIWAIYAHFTFGSFIPNTLAAKQAQSQLGLGHSFLQRLTTEWVPSWGNSFTFKAFPLINFWWIILLVGFFDALWRKHRWLILVGWITLYISAYTYLNVSAYWWYQLPILFILNLYFGLGIIKIIEILARQIKHPFLSFSTSILLSIGLIFILAKPTFNAALTYQGDARGESYTALSRWFREHTKSSESIAYIEIGYLGYYTNNRIIDLAGLVLPDIVPHIAEGDFAWGFWHYKPDYYVFLKDFDWALASIRANPKFNQQYKPVATLPGPRETDFIIFKRNSQ